MDGVEELFELGALVVGERTRLGISTRCVDAHVVPSRHYGMVGVIGDDWLLRFVLAT